MQMIDWLRGYVVSFAHRLTNLDHMQSNFGGKPTKFRHVLEKINKSKLLSYDNVLRAILLRKISE